MISLDAILEGLKLFFSKTGAKILIVLILVGLVLFGLYKVYSFGKSTQALTDNAKISGIQTKLDTANKQLTEYKNEVQHWKDVAQTESTDFKKKEDQINQDAQNSIDKANKNAAYWEKLAKNYKELSKYVSAQADSRCVIPTGFVQLFNQSASATYAKPFVFSSGASASSDTPSGVSLSTVASVIVINNARAVQLRKEVIAWQDWYKQTAANWNNAHKGLRALLPKTKMRPRAQCRRPLKFHVLRRCKNRHLRPLMTTPTLARFRHLLKEPNRPIHRLQPV